MFSKVSRGNNQVLIHLSDVHKTATTTPFGLWEFLHMPSGLRNKGQTFQRLMNGILQELPFAFVYIDNILIASRTKEEHLLHLRAVFKKLKDNRLIIRPDKCLFGRSEIAFLGHLVSLNGISPIPEKVRVIQEFPRPTAVHGLTQFLGLLNFYHHFIPTASSLLWPLHLVCHGQPPDADVPWDDSHTTCFTSAKDALTDAAYSLTLTQTPVCAFAPTPPTMVLGLPWSSSTAGGGACMLSRVAPSPQQSAATVLSTGSCWLHSTLCTTSG